MNFFITFSVISSSWVASFLISFVTALVLLLIHFLNKETKGNSSSSLTIQLSNEKVIDPELYNKRNGKSSNILELRSLSLLSDSLSHINPVELKNNGSVNSKDL